MHLKSSYRPTQGTQEDVPIILFKRGEKRKFLKRPDTYEDMVHIVRRKFDIHEHEVPTFETRSLEVCGNHNVEIDEEVFPLMLSYLDEIEVVLPNTDTIVGISAGSLADSRGLKTGAEEDMHTRDSRSALNREFEHERQRNGEMSETEENEPEAVVTIIDDAPRKQTGKGKGKDAELADTDTDVATTTKKWSRTEEQRVQPQSDSDEISKKPRSKTKAKVDAKGKVKQNKLPEVFEMDEAEEGASTGKRRGKATKSKADVKETQKRIDNDLDHDVSEHLQSHGQFSPVRARSSMRQRTPSLQPMHFNPSPEDEDFFMSDLDQNRHKVPGKADPANLFDDEIVEIEHVPRVAEREPMSSANTAEEMEVDHQLTEASQTSPSSSKDGRWEHVKVKTEKHGEDPNESERDTRKPNSRGSPSNTSSLATFAGRLGKERPDTQSRMTSTAAKPSSSRSQQTPTNANDTWGPSQSRTPAVLPSQTQDSGEEYGEDGYTADGKFKVYIEGPNGANHKAEFMTRERHLVRKVLQGACRHFGVSQKHSQLQLLFDIEEDGETVTHYYKCEKEETMGKAGVKPFAQLRVKVENDDED